MDKNQYISEGLRQLQSKHYMQVEKPNLDNLHNIIQRKIVQMHSKGTIDKETYRFLSDNTPATWAPNYLTVRYANKKNRRLLWLFSHSYCAKTINLY